MKEEDKYEESLRKLKLNDSFNVPDGFFEELPGKVMDKINLAEGKTIAASNSFSTPEGYFEKLPLAISDRISSKSAPIPLFKRRIVLIPFAFAMLVAGFIFFNQDSKTERSEFTYEDIENSTYFQSIDEDMLYDELIATDNKTITNDSLTQYILNNIELSDLENAL